MITDNRTHKDLLSEIESLKLRLEESEETLHAIHSGEADAIIISRPEGEQIFSLQGADYPYRILVENMKDGAAFLDPDNTINYCNKKLASLLQFSMRKLIGSKFTDYIKQQDRMLLANFLENPQIKGFQKELTLTTRSGNEIPVVLSTTLVTLNDKILTSIIITDISILNQTKLLQEKERLLSQSQRISQIGSWSYNLTDCVIWSDETYRLFSVSPESFSPTIESLMTLIYPDDRLKVEDWIAACSTGAAPVDSIFRHCLPDGSFRYLNCSGELLKNADGTPSRIVGTIQNITERYQIEQALWLSEEQLRLGMDSANMGIFDWDISTDLISWSQRSKELLGFGHEEFIDHFDDALCHLHPEDLPILEAEIARSRSARDRYACEYRVFWPDRSLHWILALGEFFYDAKGQALRMIGILQDITERKITQAKLSLAASVFSQSREGIIITNTRGTIIEVNDAFTYITGYSHEEALGQNPRFLKSDRHEPEVYVEMWQALTSKGHWYGELWNRRKNGEEYAELINISAVKDSQSQAQNYIALFSDITSAKEHQQQMEHAAHFDALTGLPNRLLLSDRLEQAVAQTQRRNCTLAVVYLDLDGFKEVNDQWGHQVGDCLLQDVAQRMVRALRKTDTLARIGGDEFVAILVDLERPEDAEPLLKRLLLAAAEPVTVGQAVLHVSASIGVTFYPMDLANNNADELLRHADLAMYVAKHSGKNRYERFDIIQDAALKIEQENLLDIRQALDRNEFVLHYQPKVNMKTGTVVGAEALIRWQHPQQGLLLPAAFLPIINNHPFGIELGEWVLDAAFAQLSEWHEQNFFIPVSVNIDANHLQHFGFVEHLKTRLATYSSVHPDHLELEILESSALNDINSASKIMQACDDIGVHFALDDFGTGYSSLTYLKRLPVNIIKIDQSFVRDMLIDSNDLSIIEGVIGLAKAFHQQVIAEGVETLIHCERLIELGCDFGQGYIIARPMPSVEIPKWVTIWQQNKSWKRWQINN